jgi:hypothetical protein
VRQRKRRGYIYRAVADAADVSNVTAAKRSFLNAVGVAAGNPDSFGSA